MQVTMILKPGNAFEVHGCSAFVPGTDDGGEQASTLQAFEKLWLRIGEADQLCP
jgi:hypothetical protein